MSCYALKIVTDCVVILYLEGEGISLFPNFLHEAFLHWCQGWASTCDGIHLNTLDPDVSPEGHPNNIQILTSIAEGTSKVDKYCNEKGHI